MASDIPQITDDILTAYGIDAAKLASNAAIFRSKKPKLSDNHVRFLSLLANIDYRFNHLYPIRNRDSEVEVFKLNPAQKFMLENMWYYTIVLKERQIGSTTFWVLLCLDQCLFIPNTKVGIIAHTQDAAQEILEDKIKFAFNNLPEEIKKDYLPLVTDRKDKLEFPNGSSIYVDCSVRSGTYQILLVTEFGKSCAQFPEKAEEIVTGGFPTVATGNYLIVESTAEGWEGYFYEYCQEAIRLALAKIPLSKKDFKFIFLGWYLDPRNSLSDSETANVPISKEDAEYFLRVEVEVEKLSASGHILPIPGNKLSNNQRSWYVVTRTKLKDRMFQEYPSYPDEAFSNSAKAAYFCNEIVLIRSQKRLMTVPYQRGFPVNTGWDFGKRGYMTIWFHQYIHGENRMINYYENFGLHFSHYVGYMQKLGYDVWGTHYLPHDATTSRLLEREGNDTYKSMLENLGLKKIEVIMRTGDKRLARATAGNFLTTCFFDSHNCALGIERLENYRRVWNARSKEWRESEEESHGADSFIALACGRTEERGTNTKVSDFLKNRVVPDISAFR